MNYNGCDVEVYKDVSQYELTRNLKQLTAGGKEIVDVQTSFNSKGSGYKVQLHVAVFTKEKVIPTRIDKHKNS